MSDEQQVITPEKYLEIVKRYRTLDDAEIASKGGWGRTTVWRFRTQYHPETYESAKVILEETDRVKFSNKKATDLDFFKNIPIIAHWKGILDKGKMTEKTKEGHLSSLRRVCDALGVHPSNLDIDLVSDNVYKWKEIKEKRDTIKEMLEEEPDDEELIEELNNVPKYPRGCAYNTIRKPLRSFFSLVHGISGEMLTSKGIGAETSKGTGSMARERIPKHIRALIIENMKDAVIEVITEKNGYEFTDEEIKMIEMEMKALCIFMYYTATRINASLSTKLNDPKNIYYKNYWEIHICDKGEGGSQEGGGQDWQKRIIGDCLTRLQKYINERFNIPIDVMHDTLPFTNNYLFPILHDKYDLERQIMKRVQEKSGYKTRMQNHVWRHTFAQDWLRAMDGNYETGAEIGGWKDIGTMKRCYGAVAESVIQRGLRKAMGLPLEDQEETKLEF